MERILNLFFNRDGPTLNSVVADKLFQQGEEVYVICLIQFIPGASSINHKVVMISA